MLHLMTVWAKQDHFSRFKKLSQSFKRPEYDNFHFRLLRFPVNMMEFKNFLMSRISTFLASFIEEIKNETSVLMSSFSFISCSMFRMSSCPLLTLFNPLFSHLQVSNPIIFSLIHFDHTNRYGNPLISRFPQGD